jgi:hypothetical protein
MVSMISRVLQVALMPSYYALGSIGGDKARSRPLYSITEDQKHAAEDFLRVSCRPVTSLLPALLHSCALHQIVSSLLRE